jgi:hypothetical protein
LKTIVKATILFFSVAVAFIVLGLIVALWLPSHIYINTSGNQTESAATYQIAIQTIPAIVNGLVTATGIIVGFSGTIVGIVFREFAERNDKLRRILFDSVLFIFPLILLFDFFAYYFLLTGNSRDAFVTALVIVLNGFLAALLLLIGIFNIISLLFEEHRKRLNAPNPPQQQVTCPITPDQSKFVEGGNKTMSTTTHKLKISVEAPKAATEGVTAKYHYKVANIGVTTFNGTIQIMLSWNGVTQNVYQPLIIQNLQPSSEIKIECTQAPLVSGYTWFTITGAVALDGNPVEIYNEGGNILFPFPMIGNQQLVQPLYAMRARSNEEVFSKNALVVAAVSLAVVAAFQVMDWVIRFFFYV